MSNKFLDLEGTQYLIDKVKEMISVKATKASTLVGYGIRDAYTKQEVNAIRDSINSNIASTQNMINSVSERANDTYTKSEVDGFNQTTSTEINNVKQDVTQVSDKVDNTYTKQETDNNIQAAIDRLEEQDPKVPDHVKEITEDNINDWNNKSDFSGSYNDLNDKPTIPANTSELTNDSNFATTSYVDDIVGEIENRLSNI